MKSTRQSEHNRAEIPAVLDAEAMSGLFGALHESALMVVLDSDWKITHANDLFTARFDPDNEGLVGRNCSEFQCKTEKGSDWGQVQAGINTGETWQGELCLQPREGGSVWLSGLIHPVMGEGGELRQVVALLRDISREKGIEAEFNRSQMLNEEAAVVARLGAWECDLVNDTVHWSDATRKIHEVDEDYVPDVESGIGFYKPGPNRERIAAFVKAAIKDGTPYDEEFVIITAKGRERWVRSIGHAEHVDGQCVRIFGVFQDIDREKRLRLNHESTSSFLRTVLNAATEFSIVATDKEGLISLFNTGAEKLLGYRSEEVLGQCTPSAFHAAPEVAERGAELSERLGRKVEGFEVFVATANEYGHEGREWTYVRKDGSHVPVLLVVSPQTNAEGEIIGYIGIARDISQRKKALEDLRASEHRFRSAFTDSAIGMAVVGLDGRWIEVNASLCNIFGYTESELLQLTFQDITHKEDLEADLDLLRETLEGKRNSYMLYKRYWHASGRKVWARLTVTLVRDSEGKPVHFISQVEDLSANRQLEAALTETKDRLAMATRSSGIGIWDWDIKSNELIWDEQMFALYGRDAQSFKPSYETWHGSLHAEDRERLAQEVDAVIEGEAEFDTEFRIVWPDGTIRHMRGIATLQHNEEGQATRMVGTNWDITPSVEQREELARLARSAEEASRAKSQFLANMSHEIRTPLNGIIGMTDLLFDSDDLSEEHVEFIDIIRRSGTDLMSLVNDILDFSKIEAGRMDLDIQTFSLEKMISEAFDLFRNKAESRGLTLDCHVGNGLPDQLEGDPLRIRQVLNNLISNAIKFTNEGRVNVRVEQIETHAPDTLAYLRFAVKDTGIGIEPSAREKMFQEFSQADSSTSRLYGGTGLGLAISKNLVELMGGEIGVESEVGHGSEFWFRLALPCVDTDPHAAILAQEKKAPEPADVQTHEGAYGEKGYRILFAEDNQTNQYLATALFRDTGLQVDFVENGIEALEALKRSVYDLVLMDVQMPQMDGHEATRQIRAGKAGQVNRDIPILAVTAHTQPEVRQACMSAGMNGYIQKPINRTQMFELIDSFLTPSTEEIRSSAVDETLTEENLCALFDRDSFIERVMGDMEIAKKVTEHAREDIKRHLNGLEEALAQTNPEQIHFHIHAIKGVALLVECQRVAKMAETIQRHPKDHLVQEVTSQMERLQSHAKEALDALDNFLGAKQTPRPPSD